MTWEQARQRVLEVAAGFAALGLAPGERVALMRPNRGEHVLADRGLAEGQDWTMDRAVDAGLASAPRAPKTPA